MPHIATLIRINLAMVIRFQIVEAPWPQEDRMRARQELQNILQHHFPGWRPAEDPRSYPLVVPNLEVKNHRSMVDFPRNQVN